MRTHALALLAAAGLSALPACSDGDPDVDGTDDFDALPSTAEAESALGLYATNPQGNLSIVTPPESPWVGNPRDNGWNTIDALSGLAHAHDGDSLEIVVSAEIQATSNVWLRALVDGKEALPSDTLFEWADTGTWDGVRSFRFVQEKLEAGPHIVEIQWLGDAKGVQIRDRTLSLNTAARSAGDARLAVVAAKSGPSIPVTSTTWKDIPDLTTQLESATDGDMRIAFSGEAEASSGTMLVRAIVDGKPTDAVRFTSDASGLEMSSRSFVFRAPALKAGWHDVRMQWAVAGSGQKAWLGDRTMTVYSAPGYGIGGGLATAGESSKAPVTPSPKWAPVPGTAVDFATADASSVVELAVSMEAKAAPGRLFTRVLVDGAPVKPSDVTMVQNVNAWGAYEFTFQLKNLPAGKHWAQVEAMVDSGTTASIGTRTLTVTSKRRDGADFAQPFRGTQRTLQPRDQVYENIVICLNPHRVDPVHGEAPAPDYAELANNLLGWDNGPNLFMWFWENSDARVRGGGHHFLGCYDAPPAHQGDFYWNTANGFKIMHEDALTLADQDIDFHAFDDNGDGNLTPDEAVVTVIKPQWGTFGQAGNSVTVNLDDGPAMNIRYTDIYWQMNPSTTLRRFANVGIMAHEISHEILGARDAYESPFPNTPLTIMAEYGFATHIDPAHKLFSGHVLPEVVEIGSWATNDVQLAAIEKHHDLLVVYDNSRVDEFFLIENRWVDKSNHDSLLDYQGAERGGVVVWRVVRDWTQSWWAYSYNTPLASLHDAGDFIDLSWQDGTDAHIRVLAHEDSPKEVTWLKLIKQ
jgi:M6 family metalloprotease-like protein